MSEMQKKLVAIYDKLKPVLQQYENPFIPVFNLDSKYDLWSFKEDIEVNGKKREELFFASLIIQSNYVGFYYMPIYVDKNLKESLGPELLKLLKGKSCFHIKKLDDNLEAQIDKALAIGFELYKEKGWI
ncbi:MAG: DUF1801 domain-containing protein [Candidatus Heimdallarchaeota archaeon]